jgi:hypothetical protein
MHTNAKTVALCSVICAATLLSCQKIYEPPSPPSISERGKASAEQLVYVLKALRTVYDIRQTADTFDMTWTTLDSPALSASFWDPAGIRSDLQRSLAKRQATASSPFALLKIAAARSAGAAPRTLNLEYPVDSLHLDSLYANDSVRIRAAYQFDSSMGVWDTARDSVFGRWVPGQLHAYLLDSLRRYRILDSTTRITDIESWNIPVSGPFILARKRQYHVQGADTVFLHAARCDSTIVEDSLFSLSVNSTWRGALKRNDASSGWWSQADSSVLLNYADLLVTSAGERRVTSLVDSSYDFRLSTQPQTVALRQSVDYVSGALDSVVWETIQRLDAGGDSLTLFSYLRRDYYTDNSSAACRIVRPDTTPCTLFVDLSLSAPARVPAIFGISDTSHFVYLLDHSADWSAVSYQWLTRLDFYRSAATPVSSALWTFVPRAPAPFSPFSRRPAGWLQVAASYNKGNDSTLARVWTYCDTGAADTATYIWAGPQHDTILTTYVRQKGAPEWSYGMVGAEPISRWGRVQRRGAGVSIDDTAFDAADPGRFLPVRTIHGTIDTAGAGSFAVDGLGAFGLDFSADSITLTVGNSQPLPAGAYAVCPRDSLMTLHVYTSDTTTYVFRLSAEGFISGTFDVAYRGALQPSGRNIIIRPTCSGSATLYGIFDNLAGHVEDPALVGGQLCIMLWGTNRLADEGYQFQ